MSHLEIGPRAGCDRFARELQPSERLQLSRASFEVAVGMAERLSGGPGTADRSDSGLLDPVAVREFQLSLLHVCSVLSGEIQGWIAAAVECALDHSADLGDIASVTGVSRAEAYERWRRDETTRASLIVLSQPWTDALCPDNDRYENDRGWWRVGSNVRHDARYAIVVVDRRVSRVYMIDPAGWEPDGSGGRWRFQAFGETPLTDQQVASAFTRGHLPARIGDYFPAPADRGCAPWRFANSSTVWNGPL